MILMMLWLSLGLGLAFSASCTIHVLCLLAPVLSLRLRGRRFPHFVYTLLRSLFYVFLQQYRTPQRQHTSTPFRCTLPFLLSFFYVSRSTMGEGKISIPFWTIRPMHSKLNGMGGCHGALFFLTFGEWSSKGGSGEKGHFRLTVGTNANEL